MRSWMMSRDGASVAVAPCLGTVTRTAWAATLVGLLALAVYVRTLAPTVFVVDSAELTLAASSLGLAHGPGYPVHLLLGRLFTHIPVGDLGYRMNLLSAVAGAASSALLTLLVADMARSLLPALVAGLSYAFCFYAWSVSVVAEVYTLQALFLAVMLLGLWRWRATGSRGWPVLVAALAGLAVANNPSTVLWWPGLALVAWTTPSRRSLSRADYSRAMLAFAFGSAVLLYLPLRSAAEPAFVQVGRFDGTGRFHALDLTQPGNLLWYLSGQQFGRWLFRYTPLEYAREAVRFLHWLWAAFLGVGLPLGVMGGWRLWRQDRVVAVGLALTAVPHALFFIGYRIVDKDTMFLPVFLAWAVLLGLGVDWALGRLPRQVHAVALLLPAALLWVNLSYVDLSHFRSPYDHARERLRAAGPGSLYLSTWGEAELMRYHQMVHGLRPDVDVVNLFFVTPQDLVQLVENRLEDGVAIYSTYDAPALPRRFELIETGESYRVLPRR